MRPGQRARRAAAPVLLATLLAATSAPPAHAVDALVIEAQRIVSGNVTLHDAVLRIDLQRARSQRARFTASRAELGPDLPPLRRINFACADLRLDEPRFECAGGRLAIAQSPLGALSFPARVALRTDTGALGAQGSGIAIGGGRLQLRAGSVGDDWTLALKLRGATAKGLRALLAPRVALPKDFTTEGRLDASVDLRGRGAALQSGNGRATLASVTFSNEAGTVVGENLAAEITAQAARRGSSLNVESQVRAGSGQALAGPVLLDFKANPLDASIRGSWRDGGLDIAAGSVRQQNLLQARAEGRLVLAAGANAPAAPLIERLAITLDSLRMPAAYTSFLQIALAATDFGALTTSGTLAGDLLIERDALQSLRLELQGLDLEDRRHAFLMRELRGTIHWSPAAAPPPTASFLSWREGGAYGLSGGAARVDFLAQGAGVRLTQPSRLPIFDGALAVRTFEVSDVGTPQFALRFEGDIEPIGMPRLARAFGWPEFSGQLSGRIPRVELRDNVLTFGGDVEARVFDGLIVGRNIRLQDPLGKWPRFFADVRIQNLDLAAVTSTFSVGNITGRIDGQVNGLELFAWSPVAFDAALATPASYRGPRRISAKAVGNLSNIGGGGGGVRETLGSGLFGLFDEFDYDRLGLRCRLSNDVCLMSGVESTREGYYILKGSGVPRIDIIGNAGRVNWPQLASQVGQGMRDTGKLQIR